MKSREPVADTVRAFAGSGRLSRALCRRRARRFARGAYNSRAARALRAQRADGGYRPELVDIDRLANHYIRGDYPKRHRGRISAWSEVDRWRGWGEAENTDVVHH